MEAWLSNNCAICDGSGWVHPVNNGKPDYSEVIPCRCVRDKVETNKRNYLLQNCTLPPFAENMYFDKFNVYPAVKTAYDICKEMAGKPRELKWIGLLGGNGNGKTHLAISVCRAWISSGVPAKYTLVSLLLDELREGFKTDEAERSYGSRFRYYCNIPLLLLDDYGWESSTPWVQEKLNTLVDYRLMNNLSLIVTSNKTLDEISPSIRSRLMRHPKCSIIAILADDYSLRGKN